MNTWNKVDTMLTEWKNNKSLKPYEIVVKLANACIGWSYVFGARGVKCTPANRRAWYNSKQKETIKTKCKNFNGNKRCSGCKWYPGGVTLFYDCRGFTYWCLLKAAGIEIMGAGATSQFNDDKNWSQKGSISDMPKDKVCCVFRWDGKTMAHTLLYDGDGHYIHCSGEVKKCDMSKYAATHYAIPKGLYSDEPTPEPSKPPEGKAIVSGKNVAMREGPTDTAKVITRLPEGTTVDLASQPVGWTYVTGRKKTGFMMNMYIRDNGDGTFTVTGKNVAIRSGPSTSTTVLVRIPTNNKVGKATQPKGWEYVKYGIKEGFMMKKYLRE